MQFIIDVHLHSRFARATSRELNPSNLHKWSALKGVDVVGTGDYTHPEWFAELSEQLEPAEEGLYQLEPGRRAAVEQELPERCRRAVRFMLSVEISTIYKKGDKTRKIHHVVILPSLESVARLNRRLGAIGNLKSDGRPILGLDSRDLLEICLEADENVLFIPAHIWTPHFAALGASSGFDSLEECYEDLLPHIFAVETGLSSDPPMNWRLSALDRYAIVSNSDAHSPQKLAREATCFDTECSYPGIYSALKDRDPARFLGTLEFYPEEGKYHYDGHRKCAVCYKPEQTLAAEGICPVCGRKLTVGVLHRVEKLADRPEGFRPEVAPPYEYLIPLDEVIGAAVGVGPKSKKVRAVYDRLLAEVGTELEVLRRAGLEEIESCAGPLVAEGVRRMRCGEVDIYPGHDGEYGVISVFSEEERTRLKGQGALFDLGPAVAKTAEEVVPMQPPRPDSTAQVERDADALDGAQVEQNADELDDSQRQIEEAEGGPLVVVAGPGSGKTRVLTRRIARLVASGVDPGQIMAITFTRRAAGQMRQRLSALLGGELGAMQVGTFHRLALSLLRELAPEEAGAKLVLDEVEARRLLEGALVDAELSGSVAAASQVISLAKAAAQGSAEIAEERRPHYDAYQEALHSSGACDYDDILLDLLRLLEADVAVREQVRARFPYLLIDEFQDLNAAQYRLFLQLAGEGAGLMAIGDPDQAIYSFRGASPAYFVHLRDRFSDTRLFHLGANYRSQGHIIEAAAAVIGHNSGREAIELAPMRPGKERIRLIEVPSETAEGIAVVREIARMVGGTDMVQTDAGAEGTRSFADFAVLFRTGRQGQVLEECFRKEGLPYRLVGQKGFLQAPTVRAALAFARYTLISQEDLRRWQALEAMGVEPRILRQVRRGELSAAAEDKVEALEARIAEYRQWAAEEGAGAWVRRWQGEFGDPEDEDLEHLARVADAAGTLQQLLETVLLGAEADYEERGGPQGPEAVALMTLHAAKGLEFPVVFICGVEDGLIPFRERDADLAEERRLFYVGMTRAEEELVLLRARSRQRYGERVQCALSPFVEEIPAQFLVREDVELPRRREAEQLSLF